MAWVKIGQWLSMCQICNFFPIQNFPTYGVLLNYSLYNIINRTLQVNGDTAGVFECAYVIHVRVRMCVCVHAYALHAVVQHIIDRK